MKAVIPAAGLGTRFLPATKAQPKEMLPIVDKPAIQYVVEEAVSSGIDDIIIITGRGKRSIEDHFDKSPELENMLKNSNIKKKLDEIKELLENVDIHYIRQQEPLGLGHAIYCAKKHINNEPFAVLLGDDILESEIPVTKQLIELNKKYNSSVIAVEEVPKNKISFYGIIKYEKIEDSVFLISDLIEKPKIEEAPSNFGIIGRYVLMPEIFDCIEKTKPGINNEIQLTDALKLLKNLQKIYAYKFNGKRFDIGNKEDYIKTVIYFSLKHSEIRNEIINYVNSVEFKNLLK
ncbi:MAG: UTP--glucose-1-phosphate uridylyltransferase GalU [Candidatus Aenigmatarchaeota archaeon]